MSKDEGALYIYTVIPESRAHARAGFCGVEQPRAGFQDAGMNPPAEFCVHGTPVSLSARSAGKWQTAVTASARRAIPYLTPPHTEAVTVVLAYFYFIDPGNIIDVDNMAKPILDALEGVIFENDRQVQELRVRRTAVEDIPGDELAGASGVLANTLEKALLKKADFVYIRVEDPPDHGSAP